MAVPLWCRAVAWLLQSLCLIVLSVALVTVSFVDADGDPTTTNLPSIVLVTKLDISAKDDAGRVSSEPDLPARQRSLASFWRRLVLWSRASEHSWYQRVLPIRGP